ncbi:TnsA-like heteromeric transposase endonuclease subunit [Streptomyces sp. NPDC006356]
MAVRRPGSADQPHAGLLRASSGRHRCSAGRACRRPVEPGDAVKFEVTAAACGRVGWGFERVGVLDPVLAANLRWLSGYRHPRVRWQRSCGRHSPRPRGLLAGVGAVGDPIAVLPVLFHLLWCRDLAVDLEAGLLSAATLVGPAPAIAEEVGGDAGTSAATVAG